GDDARDRIDLGPVPLGPVVALEFEAARALPRSLPLLLRVLHAAVLRRAGPAPREPLGCVRDLRRRADPDQLPGHPAPKRLHPPGRVRPARAADVGLAVPDFLCQPRSDAVALRRALPPRARREAHRRTPARAAGADRMTTEEKYVAAAYLVVFVVLL